jgi:hypothetical protein
MQQVKLDQVIPQPNPRPNMASQQKPVASARSVQAAFDGVN